MSNVHHLSDTVRGRTQVVSAAYGRTATPPPLIIEHNDPRDERRAGMFERLQRRYYRLSMHVRRVAPVLADAIIDEHWS